MRRQTGNKICSRTTRSCWRLFARVSSLPRILPVLLSLLSLSVVFIVSVAECRPLVRRFGNFTGPSASVAMDFLMKYGYLPPSDLETGNLRTEEKLRSAIKLAQKFGNIPQTGVLDADTIRLMKMRRCGVPDIVGTAERVKRYALQGQKWPGTNITWSVKEPIEKNDPLMVRGQLARAFNVWADASVLTFEEVVGHKQKADIVVSFPHGSHGDGYPFDGEGSVLAHAFFPGEGIGGDAHFDAEETWLPHSPEQEEEGVSLFAVAAHEIGHSLGLSHSSTPGSLMFPYYQVVDGQFRLPEDDAKGIQQLYGVKKSQKWATMPTANYPTSSSSSSSATEESKNTQETTISTNTESLPRTTPSSGTRYAKTDGTTSSTSQTRTAPPVTTTIKATTTRLMTTKSPTRATRTGSRATTTTTTTTTTTAATTARSQRPITRASTTVFPKRTSTDSPQVFRTESPLAEPPQTCNTSVDAVSVIRREVFLFKDQYFWRLDTNKLLKKGYPVPIERFWFNLPEPIDKVDALYERPTDTKIVFFTGRRYWLFTANELDPGYPRPITDLGLPSYVERIDAAFVWGHNGKTYLFSGNEYWKFDEIDGTVEYDYPRDISNVWRGIPQDIDAAFRWTDGNTYFLKDKKHWRFNDAKSKAYVMTSDISKFWFGCDEKGNDGNEFHSTTPSIDTNDDENGGTISSQTPKYLESSSSASDTFTGNRISISMIVVPPVTAIVIVITVITIIFFLKRAPMDLSGNKCLSGLCMNVAISSDATDRFDSAVVTSSST